MVVIYGEQCFFDSVNFFIGYHDDVQKVFIQTHQKTKMSEREKNRKNIQHQSSCKNIFRICNYESGVARSEYKYVPKDHFYKRPEQAYPMLMKVKYHLLIGVFALKVEIRHIATFVHYHSSEWKT